MIYELASRYQGQIGTFKPYAPASDRESWIALPEKLRDDLIRQGEAFLHYEYPLIPSTKYMEFVRIGNRSMFEDYYFGRRRALNSLIMAECVEYEGRFLDDIINGLIAVCEESGWQLPAHNNYDDVGHVSLPDKADPIIDLFACETGEQMAMAAYLLKDALDAVNPVICRRIYDEITERVLTPYLTKHFHWMGEKGQFVNNWTPWCTQNVMIAAFSMESTTQEVRKKVLEQAAKSLDCFLDTYGDDGCCNEGAGYYRAAGLCLFNAIEVMDACTEDYFRPLYKETKVRNIAPYIMNVHVDDRYYANFADCSPTAGRAGVREFLYAKRVGNEDMMRFAAGDHAKNEDYLLPRSENLFYRLQAAFTEEEIRNYDYSKPPVKKDIYYESVGLLIARDEEYFLAVKAGGNADSHNHNDTGSITVYRNGRPMLIDVGVETYSRKTFSPQRYEIWTMQSRYHNVLNFGEAMQKDGAEYRAEATSVAFTEEKAEISMELAGAYPEGTVKSYIRKAEFVKGKEICVTDTCNPLPEGTYLTLMTLYKPETAADGTVLLDGGGSFQVIGDYEAETEAIELTDPKLKAEWGDTLYRIRFFLKKPQISVVIRE